MPSATASRDPSTVPGSYPGEQVGGESSTSNARVEVQVSELIVGRQLRFPIQDRHGLLLLAKGAEITVRFKDLLQSRGIQQVTLHEEDAATCTAGVTQREMRRASDRIDTGIAERLNQLIDSGRLFAADAGPQFRDRIVLYGCTGYNREQRAQLIEQHSTNCAALDNMIKMTGLGQPIESEQIAMLVTNYLKHLILDTDCAVEVLNQGRRYVDLAGRCLQLSLLGMALAIETGMTEADVRMVGLAGLLHDWGMTRVPDAIRTANRPLTRVEFLEIEKHPTYTVELLQRISGIPALVALICFQVHEQPNGKGYPRRRLHSAIHPGARILNAVDAYLTLTAPQPRRPALAPYAAMISLLRSAKENSVDPGAVCSLLNVLSLFPIGSDVLLSDGRAARVIRRNGNNYDSPIVQIVRSADGQAVAPEDSGDVLDPAASGLSIVQALPAPGTEERALPTDPAGGPASG